MLRHLVRVPSRRSDTEPLPMVVMIHGRGADMNDLADLAPMLDAAGGCRFVFPNAAKPFEPYPGMAMGWTWFEGWPPQHESLVESRAEMLRFLDEVTAKYPTPEGQLIVAGFSQGALMALDAGLRTTQKLAGIIAMSGGLYEHDLIDLRSRAGVPVFIGHGADDDVVPVVNARRARRLLEDAGIDVEYHEYPMSHQVAAEEAGDVRGFVERVLRSI
ncbi:MAG TPA: dienelactone hydrolase family protein [Thermoanaerobaculia bacterium]|jgi:phospholipase/carboxylesterase|nr:dienelactone hydrolase family protein [Thermoanaerobaculia bacterium]